MKRLRSFIRRKLFCRRRAHRDVVESTGGSLLRLRCVDCGSSKALGWAVPGVSNRRSRYPHL